MLIKSALAEVAKHTETQRFKRENPEAAYKNVKSRIAMNMKSIIKAKSREHQKRVAEDDPKVGLIREAKKAESARKIANLKSASPVKTPGRMF